MLLQEMHQSHQTRLTSLTNQLNQQHASLTDQLKLEYENQLKAMSEKHAIQFDEKIQVYIIHIKSSEKLEN